MKISRLLLWVCIPIVIALAACSGGTAGPAATPAPGAATPVDAIKGFMDAAYASQDISRFVCSTPGVADAFAVIAAASSAVQGSVADTSGLTYTVKNQTADTATVTVSGQIVYTVFDNKSIVDFPTSDISVVNQNGWKFCGGAS